MKEFKVKLSTVFGLAILLGVVFGIVYPHREEIKANVLGAKKEGCITIHDGIIKASDGSNVEVGYDEWGYNYEGKIFRGKYCDAYRDAAWCQEYKDDNLQMKWNEAWLSNMDCEGDDYMLDRHLGYPSYIGSGAWLTNHMSGTNADGSKWSYYVKIVAAPDGATLKNGVWYAANGKEIGPVIWGEFAITEEVSNDKGTGDHGRMFKNEAPTGFGFYKP